MPDTNRSIRLRRRPVGMPDEDTFELVEEPIPEPGPGEVLVRNVYMSVDPAMRGRMNDVRSYSPPFAIGETLSGGAIGIVERSRAGGLPVGTLVTSNLGWREYFTAPGDRLARLDPGGHPASYALGVLGGTGLTAYVGMIDLGQPREGETVFVSGAAGAVGSVAGQIARARGCHVVGSAGSAAKVRWLTEELGFDAAFDYHETPPDEALAALAPRGIDIYFDNVGYDHLQAAIAHMNDFGRIVACGSISGYNAADPAHPRPGPDNLAFVVRKRLTMRGFIVSDHSDRRPTFLADMRHWIDEGIVRAAETFVDGIERAPQAFLGLFSGENTGKMLVRLAPDVARSLETPS